MVRLVIILGILVAAWCVLTTCSATSETRLGEFGNDYVAYMTYTMKGRGSMAFNMYDKRGNRPLYVNPRYGTDGGCKSRLILNSRFKNRWRKQQRISSFQFEYNHNTTMVVQPMKNEYKIKFDFGKGNYMTYKFPFRDGIRPNDIKRFEARGEIRSRCKGQVQPILRSSGIGYYTKSLMTGRTVHITVMVPTTGNMIIDISRGKPKKKNDARIALRIETKFGATNVMYFKSGARGIFKTLKKIDNKIRRKRLLMQIEVTRTSYKISTRCDEHVHMIPRSECDDDGEATVWVSGAAMVEKISVS